MKHLLTEDERVPPGKEFGSWTVLGQAFRIRDTDRKQPQPWTVVVCKCKCGYVAVRRIYELLDGSSVRCFACARKITAQKTAIHGDWRAKLYSVWHNIIQRCENEKCRAYKYYGGRGIRVCQEWHDYRTFRDWAHKSGYQEGLTIDRFPNKNGNYDPENCRLVDRREQQNNMRSNLLITAFGETKSVAMWSRDNRCKVSTKCLTERWHAGRRDEEALTSPSIRSLNKSA